jgi:hypothetical protein
LPVVLRQETAILLSPIAIAFTSLGVPGLLEQALVSPIVAMLASDAYCQAYGPSLSVYAIFFFIGHSLVVEFDPPRATPKL